MASTWRRNDSLHALAEARGLLGHHLDRTPRSCTVRRDSSRPAHGLCSEVWSEPRSTGILFGRQTLPEVDDVAHIGQRDRSRWALQRLADTRERVRRAILVQLVDPALVVASLRAASGLISADDAHHARRCCPPWAVLPDMPPSPEETKSIPFGFTLVPAMPPAVKRLRAAFITVMVVPWTIPCGTDVHIGAGRHLAVLRHSRGRCMRSQSSGFE